MNEALAAAIVGALSARAPHGRPTLVPRGGEPPPAEAERERGGKLAQGAALAGEVRAAVEAARRAPAAF
eukprot:71664-Pleurochrysis_carterae.AAC.1